MTERCIRTISYIPTLWYIIRKETVVAATIRFDDSDDLIDI